MPRTSLFPPPSLPKIGATWALMSPKGRHAHHKDPTGEETQPEWSGKWKLPPPGTFSKLTNGSGTESLAKAPKRSITEIMRSRTHKAIRVFLQRALMGVGRTASGEPTFLKTYGSLLEIKPPLKAASESTARVSHRQNYYAPKDPEALKEICGAKFPDAIVENKYPIFCTLNEMNRIIANFEIMKYPECSSAGELKHAKTKFEGYREKARETLDKVKEGLEEIEGLDLTQSLIVIKLRLEALSPLKYEIERLVNTVYQMAKYHPPSRDEEREAGLDV